MEKSKEKNLKEKINKYSVKNQTLIFNQILLNYLLNPINTIWLRKNFTSVRKILEIEKEVSNG